MGDDMITITIVGAGVQGTRMADKYLTFPEVSLRAVISPHKRTSKTFQGVPFFTTANAWKKRFGRASGEDVFDLCVHQDILVSVLKECVRIGVQNFILPKPVALTQKELNEIEALVTRHNLNVVVASQWHYATLIAHIKEFVQKNKKSLSSVEITFSRPVDATRRRRYTAQTMFLPHLLQIAVDTGVVTTRSRPTIEVSTREKMSLRYTGTLSVHLETDLTSSQKTETVRIYLKGEKKPVLVADLAGARDVKGFYTSLSIQGIKRRVHEDVLEVMLKHTLPYFRSNRSPKTLTLKRYLPIAHAVIDIAQDAHQAVVVVGGGIFGVLSALEIAERGYPVTILEKASEILTGASLVNQCRVHMGYHYPRDTRTAKQSLHAKTRFEEMFSDAIVKRLNNYYLIAKEGSFTTAEDYLAFCTQMKLPHAHEWPKRTHINREKIALSVRVPEQSFDASRIRTILTKKLSQMSNVTLMTSSPMTGLTRNGRTFHIQYETNGEVRTLESGAIVNATYGGLNHINRLAGVKLHNYQYELCEMLVARTPWRGTGWSIIDGPFFGVMPFGFSKDYLLYDVELSVLERSIGAVPQFVHDVAYYDTPARRAKRFVAYKKKWRSYAPEIDQCEHLYSLYVVRTVLPKKEKTDTRPTLIKQRAPGFWKLFSGKVTTSVPAAIEVAREVDAYLQIKHRYRK